MNDKIKWKIAGEKLRSLRKKTSLSVFKAAKRIHVSGNYLSLLERGIKTPSDVVLCNLAEFYNIEKAELFALYNKMPPVEINELLSNPSLRKVITQISTDKNLSSEDKEHISKQLHKFINELLEKK